MRVLVLGNNLNQGSKIAEIFTGLGFDALALEFGSDALQDTSAWWTQQAPHKHLNHWPVRPESLSLRRRRRGALRELRTIVDSFDLVVAREDFPSMLIGVRPRVIFWAQGADIQVRPWQLSHDLRNVFSSRMTSRWRALFSAPIRWMRSVSQRRGIRTSDAVVIAPYQLPLARKIGVPNERIYFSPTPTSDIALPNHLDEELLEQYRTASRGVDELLRDSRILIYHPTRILLGDSRHRSFCKNNEVLIKGLARYLSEGTRPVHLLLTRKGDISEIISMERLIDECQVSRFVTWIHPMPPWAVTDIMKRDRVVVADQFSRDIPTLGDIGRLATNAGCPLITSYSGVDDVMFESAPPNVFLATSPRMVSDALRSISQLSDDEWVTLSHETQAWFDANLSPQAISQRIGRMLHRVLE